MPLYRIYRFDQDGHTVGTPVVVDCPDDQAAKAQAVQYIDGVLIEVWDQARMVARFNPSRDPKNS